MLPLFVVLVIEDIYVYNVDTGTYVLHKQELCTMDLRRLSLRNQLCDQRWLHAKMVN